MTRTASRPVLRPLPLTSAMQRSRAALPPLQVGIFQAALLNSGLIIDFNLNSNLCLTPLQLKGSHGAARGAATRSPLHLSRSRSRVFGEGVKDKLHGLRIQCNGQLDDVGCHKKRCISARYSRNLARWQYNTSRVLDVLLYSSAGSGDANCRAHVHGDQGGPFPSQAL